MQTVEMSEVAKSAGNVLARFSGNTVGSAVSGLLVLAAGVLNKPELALVAAPIGAFSGSMAEEAAYYAKAAWTVRGDRVQDFVDEVEGRTESSIDDLVADAAKDQSVLHLLAKAVDAAANAHNEEKIRLLARAFVRGASDRAFVDDMLILVELLEGMEIPEIRLLSVLATKDDRLSTRMYGGRLMYVWTIQAVVQRDPGLARVLVPLYQKLARAGFVDLEALRNDNMVLTPLGETCGFLLLKVDEETTESEEDQ